MQHTQTEDVIGKLRSLGSATVYEAQGAKGAFDSGIKPIAPTMHLAGRALTIDMRPADNLMLHYAMLKARPGDVLVVDAKGFLEAGPWGDVFTEQALATGLAGLVIDGAVRDSQTIIDMNFPVFCRGLSIKGTGKNQPGEINVPITIAGVTVHPGDIIVGDRDGLVVVAAHEVEAVLKLAQEREQKEIEYREKIRQGATTARLLGLEEKLKQLQLD
jgi:4-hydroxy-4-methyl-2-oxoglutarate aldolase